MVKIKSPIKDRVLQLVDYKGVSKKDFFQQLGVSTSNFRSQNLYSEVGGDVIAKILATHPEVNPDWLINGEGDWKRPQGAQDIKKQVEDRKVIDIVSQIKREAANDKVSCLLDELMILYNKLQAEKDEVTSDIKKLLSDIKKYL